MKKQIGFTLVELMAAIGILGILAATAVPVYRTWLQRAYGSEATLMMRKLIDGQIMYYLDNNTFFPATNEHIVIPPSDPPTAQTRQDIQDILDALKLPILVGHHLEYTIVNNGKNCTVTIRATFPLFKGGYKSLYGMVENTGKVTIHPI